MRLTPLLFGITFAAGAAAQCPSHAPAGAARFDTLDARALAGTYHLVMQSEAPGPRPPSASGRLLLWVPDTLTEYYELAYVGADDSAGESGPPGAERMRETWRRTAHPQLLQGATTLPLGALGAPAREDLTSRDPRSPGLLLDGDVLIFAPRMGWKPVDGEWTKLRIERMNREGFWGTWFTKFHHTGRRDARGTPFPPPHGRFCAEREH